MGCYDGIPVGETCTAECSYEYGYSGEGYTSTCKPDGSWSRPTGSCDDYYYEEKQVQCFEDCQVANCDGCRCGEDYFTGQRACQCNARQGFVEWSFT
jgi:hypothetical protein